MRIAIDINHIDCPGCNKPLSIGTSVNWHSDSYIDDEEHTLIDCLECGSTVKVELKCQVTAEVYDSPDSYQS